MASNLKIPKIAVITRTKNRNLLLKRALESAQSQTFKDFIQVVVNDGGDPREVDKLTKAYPVDRIKVIHHKESVGLTNALNIGIESVKSEYITILDDDDTWSNDRLEKLVKFLDESGAKGVVDTMDRVIEEIRDGEVVFVSKDRLHPGVTSINLYKQCLDNYLSNGCFTYRREVYEELKGYDATLGVAEDWDFGIRFLLKYDVEFLSTPEALSFYHHRPDQKGHEGNSVFAGIEIHKKELNKLANKFLRQDIAEGKLGVGYIMNSLRYERDLDQVREGKAIERVVRLEGHMNYVGREVIDATTHRIINSRPVKRAKNHLKKWAKK